jgi:hypothetical protein
MFKFRKKKVRKAKDLRFDAKFELVPEYEGSLWVNNQIGSYQRIFEGKNRKTRIDLQNVRFLELFFSTVNGFLNAVMAVFDCVNLLNAEPLTTALWHREKK